MATVQSTTQEVRFICLDDYSIVKANLQEVADHIASNPSQNKWITVPVQIITING